MAPMKLPIYLNFDHKKLAKALENEGFYSHILTININGKPQKAVLKDLQRHPSRPLLLHMDLLRITGKEKITMHVPLHFLNGDKAPGVVDEAGIVSHVISDVEVRCLPDNLPEYIEVDLAQLKLGDTIHLADLKLPKGVELTALTHGHDNNAPVASIHIPRAALEEEAVATEEATTEAAPAATPATAGTAATASPAPATKPAAKKEK
jgi:large subunit ribosomal protein L25